jgi:hypothetical protein
LPFERVRRRWHYVTAITEYDIDFVYCRGAGINTTQVYRCLTTALRRCGWKHKQYSVWSKRRAAGISTYAAEHNRLKHIANVLEARFDPNGAGGGRRGLFKRFYIQKYTRSNIIR